MEGYIGEIRAFAGNYAPEYWHICDGSSLPINQYQALYSLLGTRYGGDGVNTFNLPNLLGRMPIGQGQGPNLTARTLGSYGGSETVALTVSNLPAHTHFVMIDTTGTPTKAPNSNTLLGVMSSPEAEILGYLPGSVTGPATIVMDPRTITATGGNQPHSNIMPCAATTYIICVDRNLYPTPG